MDGHSLVYSYRYALSDRDGWRVSALMTHCRARHDGVFSAYASFLVLSGKSSWELALRSLVLYSLGQHSCADAWSFLRCDGVHRVPVQSNFICRIASRISCDRSCPSLSSWVCRLLCCYRCHLRLAAITHRLHKSAFRIASGERPTVRRNTIIESSSCGKSFIVYTSLPRHLLAQSRQNRLGPRCADSCQYCTECYIAVNINTKSRRMSAK
jgi:hypothetical protein